MHGNEDACWATNLACPPCNIGPLSTPNYPSSGQAAVHKLPGGRRVFAGQRAEGFYVDLGSIFDLGDLRPFQNLARLGHGVFTSNAGRQRAPSASMCTRIAIQVPISDLRATARSTPTASAIRGPSSGCGQRPAAARFASCDDTAARHVHTGPFDQVSRLGNPLFNEVIVPMADKDEWNHDAAGRRQASTRSTSPIPSWPTCCRCSIPARSRTSPRLTRQEAPGRPGRDPAHRHPGRHRARTSRTAPGTHAGRHAAPEHVDSADGDAERSSGCIGGDLAGFPNGRRLADDVVTIELRAIAGATYPLIDPAYSPDSIINGLSDGVTSADVSSKYLNTFPYLGVPYDGYHNPS